MIGGEEARRHDGGAETSRTIAVERSTSKVALVSRPQAAGRGEP